MASSRPGHPPFWQLAGLFFLLAFPVALSFHFIHQNLSRQGERERLGRVTEGLAAAHLERLNAALAMAETLAASSETRRALGDASVADDSALLIALRTVREALGAELVYVMASNGVVIASASDGVPSITGQNFAFRTYFLEAMQGRSTLFPALGVVTGTRGLYASAPVPGRRGVAVVKLKVDWLEKPLGGDAPPGTLGLLVSPEGVAFTANEGAWRLKALEGLDASRERELRASRQFGDTPIEAGPFTLRRHDVFQALGRRWLSFERPLFGDWAWVMAFPAAVPPRLLAEDRPFFLALCGGGVIFVLSLWGLGWGLMRRRRLDRAARALEVARRAELETEVAARTAELMEANHQVRREADERRQAESALHQAEKLQAVGELAGGIAHDFNNQLTSVMGFAELIREGGGTGHETIAHAEKILLAARTGADLASRLLSFARREPWVAAPCDVHEVVAEVAGLLRHAIDRRIQIRLSLESPRSTVMGNRTQLANAILNLGLNARDAMPEGGTIRFATRHDPSIGAEAPAQLRELAAGPKLVVAVEDDGTGMDEATQRHLFEPFFTTKVRGKGTGLGLATVYHTVKSHGGAILVQSAVGRGSRFELWLPLCPEAPLAGAPVAGPAPLSSGAGKGKALVVDDEQGIRELLGEMLGQLGFDVTVAAEGRAGLERFLGEPDAWRVVVLDMVMPGMSGAECLAAMRRARPEAPIVLCSGYLPPGVGELPKAGPPFAFLSKPFSFMALREALGQVGCR